MNILYVTHRLPYPPDKGDRIRNWHVLRWLAGRGSVSLAALADEPIPEKSRVVLRQTAARFAAVPVGGVGQKASALRSLLAGRSLTEGMFHSPVLMDTVRRWARQTRFDLAVCSSSGVADYLRIPELADAARCVDIVDVDSRKWRDYAGASTVLMRRLYDLEGRRVSRLEGEICGWADGAFLVSEAETDLFRREHSSGKADVLTASNGVDLGYFAPRPSPEPSPKKLAFVGAFDYRPNVDGAVWFCREIFPILRAACPSLGVQLVGRNPAAPVRQLAGMPGIEVVGTVPDVRPYVAEALAVIAPLRIARGLQNKVLEAFAMGKPVVATPAALGGFRVEDGVPALVATAPAEWTAAIRRLFAEADFRKELGERGRAYAEAHHDWNDCLEPLARFLEPKVGIHASACSSEASVPIRESKLAL